MSKIHLQYHNTRWCVHTETGKNELTKDLTQVTCLSCLNARVGHLRIQQEYVGKWKDNPINIQRSTEQASIVHGDIKVSVWYKTSLGRGKPALCTVAYKGCNTTEDYKLITCKWCISTLEDELKYYCKCCRKPMFEIWAKGSRNPTTGDEGFCKKSDRCQLAKTIKEFKKIKKKIQILAEKIEFEESKITVPVTPINEINIKKDVELMGYLPPFHLDV